MEKPVIRSSQIFRVILIVAFAYCSSSHAASILWTNSASMTAPRAKHCATVLADGRVLVTGGETGNNAIAEATIYDPASNTWSSAGAMHTARFSHTATLLTSGQVLVAGGLYFSANNPVYVSESELYDPASNTWTSVGALNVGRSSHTATLLPSGKVLVVGGVAATVATATAEIFDPVSLSWSYASALPTPRFAHTATLLSSGQVLVVGGYSTNYLSDAQLYDPTGNNWSPAGSLQTARGFQTATLLPNGDVLVAGGIDNTNTALSSTELYVATSNSWSQGGNLSTARYSHRAVLLANGQVLALGGDDTYGVAVYAEAEVYDPAGNAWASGGGIPITYRDGHTVNLLPNGMIFVVGGQDGGLVLASSGIGSSAVSSWSPGAATSSGHQYASATLLPNGKVLLAGGLGGSSELYDPQATTWTAENGGPAADLQSSTLLTTGKVLVTGAGGSPWLYDSTSDSWSFASLPSTQRVFHTSTLLADGEVLVAGGYDPNNSTGSLSSAERYSPLTNTWSTAANMLVAREAHTATLLNDGNVLVVGGDNGSVVPEAEIYTPISDSWLATGPILARAAHTATLLQSGLVLVAGGYDNLTRALTSCQLYDPTANTWSTAGDLNTGRTGHTATLLLDGTVLVTGGYGLTGPLVSAELYNPIANTWTTIGNLATPRADQSAIMLSDGRVMVVGGDNGSSPGGLFSAETFDPGFVPQPARQPSLSAVPTLLTDKSDIVIAGSGFRPNFEASGGDSAGSADNYPTVQIMRLDNGETRWLSADSAFPFSATTFTSTATSLAGFADGYVRVTTFVDGIPSSSLLTLFDPADEIFHSGFE